jgi:hypothetical protein
VQLQELEEEVKTIRGAATQPTIDKFFATPTIVATAHKLLALAIIEGCGSVPLNFCEAPRVRELLGLFGVPPLTRKVLSTTILNQVYQKCLKEAIAALVSGKFFQVNCCKFVSLHSKPLYTF